MNIYSEKEVREEALKFFKGDILAANVWIEKYALKSEEGFFEKTPDDSINRYTDELHRIECQYKNPMRREDIYDLLKDYNKFILGGSPMFGIGNNEDLSSLGNCFVAGNTEDSYAGIMAMDEDLVQLMKRRGGVGLDLTHLRSKGSKVHNAASTSTGIIPFMERYSNTTREVAQEGRRGALMLTIGDSHPDVKTFITAKDDLSKITGANISVRLSDDFMKLDTPEKVDVWNTLVHQAWKTAEPGVLFWDTIRRYSPADSYPNFQTVSTNPCSELPLSLYDSCRLGSLNIFAFVDEPFTERARLKNMTLSYAAHVAQRLMDDLIDLEEEKIDRIISKIKSSDEMYIDRELDLWNEIKHTLTQGRRTGLGITGLADAGAALGYRYGSDEFIKFCDDVQYEVTRASYVSSIRLAEERGAFPEFDVVKEAGNKFLVGIWDMLGEEDFRKYRGTGRRNIANLTVAPTGSLSILAGVSSGIEPAFMLEYNRRRKVTADTIGAVKDDTGDYWLEYSVLHPKYQEYIEVTGEKDPKKSPYAGATAHDIDPMEKIKVQATLQQYIDHSISVTHNLPKDATEEQVGKLLHAAWQHGCKGATVYRDGCRDGVLVSKELERREELLLNNAPKRPKTLPGEAFGTTVKGEKFTVVVGLFNEKPYEVFAYKGNSLSGAGEIVKLRKGVYEFRTDTGDFIITDSLTDEQEAITRGYSMGLRHGSNIKFAVEQLSKTKGDLSSFTKAIARVLRKFILDNEKSSESCPKCEHRLAYQSGCLTCLNCGHSKC